MNNLLIIDGHNYLYRSYFGIPASAKLKNGLQVNAYYGFLSSLRKIYEYIAPSNIMVVFDSETGIKRKIENNPAYKQNRSRTDTGMFQQLPIIKQALEFMNISYVENPDFEGDDIIGTISKRESQTGNVYIASQDNDFTQLLDEKITMLLNKKGEIIRYTQTYFRETWGIEPSSYLDYISLKGDPSDNIAGVKGIGKKTALKFISEYKNIDNLILNCANKNLAGNENLIRNNKEFLRINCGLDISYKLTPFNNENLLQTSNSILKHLKYIN